MFTVCDSYTEFSRYLLSPLHTTLAFAGMIIICIIYNNEYHV